MFYLNNVRNKNDKKSDGFIGYVCDSSSDTRISIGVPGGASLYSLSVAWVSYLQGFAS